MYRVPKPVAFGLATGLFIGVPVHLYSTTPSYATEKPSDREFPFEVFTGIGGSTVSSVSLLAHTTVEVLNTVQGEASDATNWPAYAFLVEKPGFKP
ncbi:MAG: hypothetical protein J0H39_03810 [Alphaproteobacteria bacterium]|nr:hypothetical protein [Alphaproteobacteria bacterium]